MYLAEGTLLQGGKYKIVRHISSGGFGNTYEGVHTMMDARIAVKEFFPKMFCNRDENTSHVTVATQGNRELVAKLRKKFNEEAKAVFKMKHEGIVRVLDIFEENGTAYYVMEYVDGMSLNDMVKERGSLPEAEAVGYISQVAYALKYVHSLNRLHLDIKPGNIMVDRDGKAILIDFGASKHYDDESGDNTSTLMGVNTKGYAPIEQSMQGFTSFSPATDIYALGATLYKLLTGITPPDANLLLADEETLQPLPASISAATQKTVMAAMTLRRKGRPQSMDAFIALFPESKSMGDGPGIEDDEITVLDAVCAMPDKQEIHKKTFTVNGISFDMMLVQAGTFMMGATSEQEDPWGDEKPIHQVTLTNNYYIGQTEVTQALWQAVMGYNPSFFNGDNLPVECVSWNDCQDFLRKLNSLTGKCFRLPTEAEWEFAARGGLKSRGTQYSGSSSLDDCGWYDGNSDSKTHPVAMKQANELGLYDMSGNVWEWCQDWWGSYVRSSQTNPTGPGSGSDRVYRGGSWSSDPGYCRVSFRYYRTLGDRFNYLGLRLALSE